jgi:hypothetical protein
MPNIDADARKDASGPMRFRVKIGAMDELVADPLWRPFMTADPFIFAATGLANSYTFTVQDIETPMAVDDAPPEDTSDFDHMWPASEPVPAPPRPSAITRATRGTLGALKKFFNTSGD